MEKGMIFYLVSTAIALYALWLIAFRTYETDNHGRPTDERLTFPNVIYLLLFAVCFIPVLNVLFFVVFIIVSLVEIYVAEDICIKSWLFEKPKQKEKADTND